MIAAWLTRQKLSLDEREPLLHGGLIFVHIDGTVKSIARVAKLCSGSVCVA